MAAGGTGAPHRDLSPRPGYAEMQASPVSLSICSPGSDWLNIRSEKARTFFLFRLRFMAEDLLATPIDEDLPVRGVIRQQSGEITIEEFAPRSDWRAMSETEHFVQFYETDSFLLNSLGGFIGTGLALT